MARPSRRTFVGAAALGLLLPAARAGAADAIALTQEARALLGAQTGKAVLGARGAPLVTELVDVNAPDWRRSAEDMRALLAGDAALAYALVQAPRLGFGSVEAARLLLAVLASQPPRLEAFYLALAATEGPIDGGRAISTARGMGLDVYKLFRAANEPDVTESLSKSVSLAAALGVLEPPAYVIGGRVFTGYLDLARKRALIAEARACGGC